MKLTRHPELALSVCLGIALAYACSGCSSAGAPETFADVQSGRGGVSAAEVEALGKLLQDAGVEPAQFKVINASGGSLAKAPNGFLIEDGHVSAIKLSGTKLSTMEALAPLEHLKGLSLTNNSIEKISGLEKASQLVSLDLSRNKLTSLEGLGACQQLRGLKVAHNQLRTTRGLAGTKALRSLVLDNNELTDLTDLAGQANLVSVDLSSNHLTSLEGVRDLKFVRVIRVSKNRLATAAGLGALPDLEELYLDRNELTTLGEFPRLPKLAHLDIALNQLTSLPNTVTGIKGLILNGNPLSLEARQAVAAAAPRCTGDARPVEAVDPRSIAPLGCRGAQCAKNLGELSKRLQLDLGRSPYAKNPFEVRISTEYGSAKVIVGNRAGKNIYAQAWPGRPCVVRGAKALEVGPASKRGGRPAGRGRGPQKLAIVEIEAVGHQAKVVSVEIASRLRPLDDVLRAAASAEGEADDEGGDAAPSVEGDGGPLTAGDDGVAAEVAPTSPADGAEPASESEEPASDSVE